jgi:CheY-like chemotaxis protein
MSLILAIEPNKNQAQQLGALVRAHLKAELVTAPTAAAALAALGDRIPDVVLTPALFGLRDEAALTERLRQLGNDAAHVQTLSIPILAASGSKSGSNSGLLGRKKEKGGDSNVGCDPAVFAEQIRIYLQRASVERRAQASEAAARAMATAPRPGADGSPAADDLSAFMVSADEFDVDSLELPTIDPPVASEPPPPPAPPREAATDDAQGRKGRIRNAKTPAPSPVEEELGLVTPPTAGPPLWRVTEAIDDFYGGNGDVAAAISTPDMSIEPFPQALAAEPGPAANSRPVTQPPAPGAPRQRTSAPPSDEWAHFDPSQSAFKALIRKLDEIAGSAA